MQVVKTKIISLNFKLKQQHFELQPASVKDYSSCIQVAIFNKLYTFSSYGFFILSKEIIRQSRHIIERKGKHTGWTEKGDILEHLGQFQYKTPLNKMQI